MLKKVFLVTATMTSLLSMAQSGPGFEENKGQHPRRVLYKVAPAQGLSLFLEKNSFTYLQYNPEQVDAAHELNHDRTTEHLQPSALIDMHAFRMTFVGADPAVKVGATGVRQGYANYFKGQDSSRWASQVRTFEEVRYFGLYPGVDLHAYSESGYFKYDFIVAPRTNASQIQMQFSHTSGIEIKENKLFIHTTTGDILEREPYSYQIIAGKKTEVPCEYVLSDDGTTVSFHFPDGFDHSFPLIIDPILVGATYSGAPASCMTFGHCATYDLQGNIYTGGECFNPGYPTQAGSFQTTFGGNVDIAVSMLNSNGSMLMWSTYVGGSGREIPNSLVTSPTGDLYVLGSTQSSNYPVTAGCFDATHNGTSGADDDIVVTHINNTGTALIGSTYVGGSANDGGGWTTTWNMNGHDAMRGEIILDGAGNAWVASFTESANFPTSPGTYDATLGGPWDACVFRLSPNCAALQWSTFLGGSAADGGYGLKLNSSGACYVTGVTSSNDFPITGSPYDGTYNGGNSDAFVVLFNPTGSGLIASTFYGTTGNEIGYFLDLDQSELPYIYGSTSGNITPTAGVYSNPGSGNYIARFDLALSTLGFATVFGAGVGFLEPEAFMVDSCNNIYASGFNAVTGYPISANALYPTQSSALFGSCYFIVLSPNATSLLYGSFYYGNHVDGGTSRFDPSGSIYQGICMGGGNAPTPAWAWKDNVNAPGWDMFVVKIDFQMSGVNATASAAPNDTICENGTVNFTNTSNAVDFIWDFGDGSPLDTNAAPGHTFTAPGTYTVTLIAIDSSSCKVSDTLQLLITVLPEPTVFLGNDTTICGVVNVPLDATTPGCTYLWSTGATTATINATSAGSYWVQVDNGSCTARDTILITSFTQPDLGSDTTVCNGQSVLLDAGNPGSTYLWSTGATTQTITASTAGTYWVDVTTGVCSFRDSMVLTVIVVQQPDLGPDTMLCPGATITLSGNDPNASYLWSDGSTDATYTADQTGVVWVVQSVGACELTDTVIVAFYNDVALGEDISLCDLSAGITLDAGNPGSAYLWSTGATTQTIEVTEPGTYYVDVINSSQCQLSDTILVEGDAGGGMIFVPNTFTPNRNGLNDVFYAYGSSVTSFKMTIYNRWGQLMYTSTDINSGWDGRYKGNLVQEDTYIVKIEYTTECGGENLGILYRHVNVIR